MKKNGWRSLWNAQIVSREELYNGLQERRTNHRGDITCHAKLARVDIKALYGNQNIVRFLIVHQMQNTNVLAYFVPQMAGCVLNIGLKRI